MAGDLWRLGLAGWVLQDGGYADLHVGDLLDCSVEIWAEDLRPVAGGAAGGAVPGTAEHLGEGVHRVTGAVRTYAGVSVLDLGTVRAWAEGTAPGLRPARWPEGGPTPVTGTARLAVDSLVGPSAETDLPPLVHRWQVVAIDLVTTPWVRDPDLSVAGGPPAFVRDPGGSGSRPVERTRMWDDDPDSGLPEYLLTCRLLDPAPMSTGFHLGPADPVTLRRRLPDRWPHGYDGSLRDALVAAYAGPGRGYHDTTHLAEVLAHLDQLRGTGVAVVLAAWFHDAVYDGAADDEERSAAWAEQALAADPALAAEVARLVRLTATHRPGPDDRAGQLLCDADLAILAAGPERYAAYVAGVRAEHKDLSDADFRAGRRAVLTDLLAKEHLFETRAARARWEEAARANLTAEVAALS